MRIRINVNLEKSISIPINHQHVLTDVIYSFLETTDVDYASYLHGNNDSHRFQLFCFSTLRSHRRRVISSSLRLGPGAVEWLVCSPVEKFLEEFASGLLQQKHITLVKNEIPIDSVDTLPPQTLDTSAAFSCLTPVVCSRPDNGRGHGRYLTPTDNTFGEAVRHDLIRKFNSLHGHAPENETLRWQWDKDYLKRERGTKLIEYKSSFIKGAFAPFHVEGSPELIQLLYETGAGEQNAAGFGMVDVQEK